MNFQETLRNTLQHVQTTTEKIKYVAERTIQISGNLATKVKSTSNDFKNILSDVKKKIDEYQFPSCINYNLGINFLKDSRDNGFYYIKKQDESFITYDGNLFKINVYFKNVRLTTETLVKDCKDLRDFKCNLNENIQITMCGNYDTIDLITANNYFKNICDRL